ncbi:hypothetical protein BDR26DRAFT_936046 [Obelidium mucronatum]|nr:hypothetical protein BDR26DRAFT_936046 [Obelidium mucronatum]
MLANADVKHLADTLAANNQGGPEEEQSQIREYEVSCLDYSFLPTCKDKKELVNLLNVLRSGREGSYPDLEVANLASSSLFPSNSIAALLFTFDNYLLFPLSTSPTGFSYL